MAKTFDQIAADQGWDMHSQANVLRDFTNLMPEMLAQYAAQRAAEENDTNPEYADQIVSAFQSECAFNVRVEDDPTGEYDDVHRDQVRDGLLFALDNGWLPE